MPARIRLAPTASARSLQDGAARPAPDAAPNGLLRESAAEDLRGFYEAAYARDGLQAELFGRWRALGARGKADHVIALCERAGIEPRSTIEVGCGDGALLCELRARGFGGRLAGVEITDAAVAIASQREQIDAVARYDGKHLDERDGAYDLGILSHVLEHVPDPPALLAEVARACGAVLVEVPLEANVSARRAGKREHAAQVGHLQRLDRRAVRAIVGRAGLAVVGELEDPLPLAVHRFFARGPSDELRAAAKWAVRASTHRVSPRLAQRLFTVHYACLCTPSRPR
ncbi:MAG TPA: class I SAM-dependent methyltransferase [Solirubrobacteraceae bacterium]|nr:class I SAM-dependent methyltransferase [Solirubrobacteraceae bacterium]